MILDRIRFPMHRTLHACMYFSLQECAYEISVSISALVIHLLSLSVSSV